jgi:hypothetical protein
MKVMDNKLFTVDAPRGCLEPGECQTVKLSYVHCMAGTDRLPVLLKLNRGREILVSSGYIRICIHNNLCENVPFYF